MLFRASKRSVLRTFSSVGDSDPYHYYNKYGPFHMYTHLNHNRPHDPHNTQEEDPYRNEIQGYIKDVDPGDNQANANRGLGEGLVVVSLLCIAIACGPQRHYAESDAHQKKLGEALVTAQEIERFIEKAKRT